MYKPLVGAGLRGPEDGDGVGVALRIFIRVLQLNEARQIGHHEWRRRNRRARRRLRERNVNRAARGVATRRGNEFVAELLTRGHGQPGEKRPVWIHLYRRAIDRQRCLARANGAEQKGRVAHGNDLLRPRVDDLHREGSVGRRDHQRRARNGRLEHAAIRAQAHDARHGRRRGGGTGGRVARWRRADSRVLRRRGGARCRTGSRDCSPARSRGRRAPTRGWRGTRCRRASAADTDQRNRQVQKPLRLTHFGQA